jgi:UDPglucose 6-dehydrogenase
VPPGYTRRWAERLRQLAGAADLTLYYQVETLVFGKAVERAQRPERFIVGCANPRTALPRPYAEFLASFGCPVFPMRYESAELTKLAINAYLVSSVSVTNMLAGLCEALGGDWSEIVPTLKLDPRIGPNAYLSPGLGLSGGNLERDLATLQALAAEHGTEANIVDAWLTGSRHRRDWVLRMLHDAVLSREDDPVIAVWGLAYKQDTASLKNSPAVALIEALRSVAVRAYDPRAILPTNGLPQFRQCDAALDACRGADALVVMTPWQEFAAVDLAAVREVMHGRVVLDPYGVLNRTQCERVGLACVRLGEAMETKEVLA